MLGHIWFIQRSLQDNHRTALVSCTLYALKNEIMFPLGSRGFSTWDSPRPAPDPMLFVCPQFLLWWPSLCCLWSIYVIKKAVILIFDFRWFDVLMYQREKKKPQIFGIRRFGLRYLFICSKILGKLFNFLEPKNPSYKIGMTMWVHNLSNQNSRDGMCFGIQNFSDFRNVTCYIQCI